MRVKKNLDLEDEVEEKKGQKKAPKRAQLTTIVVRRMSSAML
jgi:hypothetical protein